MTTQHVSVKSPEYEIGFKIGHEWALENARLGDLDNLPDPWDEITVEAGPCWEWDEPQDADYERGFRDGYRAAFEREARRVAYDEADRVDLNGREG